MIRFARLRRQADTSALHACEWGAVGAVPVSRLSRPASRGEQPDLGLADWVVREMFYSDAGLD